MNRRHFLNVVLPALALVSGPQLRAETLQGQSAKMHGQRDRATWLAANRLAAARRAKPGELIQAIFFIDLNCPACALFWSWFDTLERRNIASLWIPVAYMNKTSQDRAISLLRAAEPYVALAQNYQNFDYENRLGNLPEASSSSLQEQSGIRRNTRFWNGSLFGTTPLTLYRKNDGTYWQLLGLLPEPEMSTIFSRLAPSRLDVFPPR